MTISTNLIAGVARLDITPPIPMDCVGFVRRFEPVKGVLTPLTATALVIEDETTSERVAIIGFDLVGIGIEQGKQIREMVGETVGCSPDSVLLNYSHTHAGPHPFDDMTLPKFGGDLRKVSEENQRYIATIPDRLNSVAYLAIQNMEPVRAAAGSGNADGISVNRRERTKDGRVILGWNREGILDTEVQVARFDRPDGTAKVVIVGFACHPVVLGGENQYVGPDYPGVVREVVENATSATCIFLQGAAGNVLPLEGFYAEEGPEQQFGQRVGFEALSAFSRIRSTDTTIEQIDYGSVTPINLFRHVAKDVQSHQPVGGAGKYVTFPLKPLPTTQQVEEKLDEYSHNYDVAALELAKIDKETDFPNWREMRGRLNPLEYYKIWAEKAVKKAQSGNAETSVDGYLQVIRIGDIAFSAVPGEPFNEIGISVKQKSAAPYTFFCGYSNEYIAYFPTAAEYPFGGYEPGHSYHNGNRLETVGPECEDIIVSNLTQLSEKLFK
ncbi:MAG: neutral/alkaline non-lysosomal ceramidase N-terminal domain-containing protein [Candidatus Berkelbacteria bacterium]|nr:neutral/alkaline non-lysosomal ceramidase N-terminal domain-containing protein [Candidatus Berkelbacteria bacterium]